ncbi:MAG: PRC-barrel domain-containing protein [Methanobrevibacter arboriphilus]|uniref:PRC-barrel domain-containing protein n=2 Tax=Methanobrevibacter arboriphilus TaxID=39441 RepID=A0A843AEB9_METAZ|nr:PRC-barrel domain-containing protein [Methanobrevibacter arboriphilus]MBF4468273.1 PRC-barrel domain-containing protein [Methanobrevibacter arboriphilus]MCC7562454.1 PRC-barrel domain-containing protein [Methanobrevibacter arboriphilus]
MKIIENIVGKEVVNTDAVLIGKVSDVEFNDVTKEVESLILKKGGISETLNISKSEDIIPYDMISKIGDKILLKDAFDVFD